MKFCQQFTLIMLLALATAGCTLNPVTGENQLTLMSPAQEIAQGAKQYGPSQQSQGGRYVADPDLNAYVNKVGQKLARVSDNPKLPYEFVVLNNNVPNAWALPGGKIAINRGLLMLLDDESQLAAVLGHEIVHAAARHSAQQQTEGTLLNLGMTAAGVALGSQDSQLAGTAMGVLGLGAKAWQAHYSRSQESQADHYGIQYMIRAGYNPEGAVELQEKFVKLAEGQKSGLMESFFSSHPPSEQRVIANRKVAAKHPGGVRNTAQFTRALAQLKADKGAYDNYQKAQQAASHKDFATARKLTDKAIAQQPRENLFWELKGQLATQQKNYSAATKAFSRAISDNPEFFRPYVYRGLAYKALKKTSAAQRDLQKSMHYLPTQIASYYLGDYALQAGDSQQAAHYFQQAAQGGGKIGQAAQARLQQLQQPH